MHHGLGATAICRILVQADGKTQWTDTAIRSVMNKLDADPTWQGERSPGSGRPRKTSKKRDKAIVKFVVDNRGRKKITANKIKRKFPDLEDVSDQTVLRRLEEQDYKLLRRRKKSKVSKLYLDERITYCKAVARTPQSALEHWAYTDGTVYYLDRSEEEFEQTHAAALGPTVWRKTDKSDALYQDCLGPSNYNKAQGQPIRIWGMLACGVLHVRILEKGEVMNTDLYCELIEDHFEDWIGNCTQLVCDFERCIRSKAAVAFIQDAGIRLLPDYPRCSQDFNAIENAWGTQA